MEPAEPVAPPIIVDGLANQYIFRTPEVSQAGGIPALQAYGSPKEILNETKARTFAV